MEKHEGRFRVDEEELDVHEELVASRRSGRNVKRAGSEVRFVNFVNLARQSRAMVLAWWIPCIIRPQRGSWSIWRRRCTFWPWEVRVANFARQFSSSFFAASDCGCWVTSRRGRSLRAFAGVIVMYFFMVQDEFEVLDGPVTSFCSTSTCCCHMKPFRLIVDWAELCFHVVLIRCAWCT